MDNNQIEIGCNLGFLESGKVQGDVKIDDLEDNDSTTLQDLGFAQKMSQMNFDNDELESQNDFKEIEYQPSENIHDIYSLVPSVKQSGAVDCTMVLNSLNMD